MVQKLKRRLHKPHRQHSSSGLRRVFINSLFPPLHLGHEGTDLKEKPKSVCVCVCHGEGSALLAVSRKYVSAGRKCSNWGSSSDPFFAVDVGKIQLKNCSVKGFWKKWKENRRELTEDVQASAFLIISHCVHPDETVRAGFQVTASVVVSGGVVLNWQPGGLYCVVLSSVIYSHDPWDMFDEKV